MWVYIYGNNISIYWNITIPDEPIFKGASEQGKTLSKFDKLLTGRLSLPNSFSLRGCYVTNRRAYTFIW